MILESKETTLEFPFRIAKNGSVAIITDQKVIWSNKVKSVLGTIQKERAMITSFGSRINEALWNTESFSKNNADAFIRQAFVQWLPALDLINVDVSNTTVSGTITISVTYKLPNDELLTDTMGIVGISGNSLPIQEIL